MFGLKAKLIGAGLVILVIAGLLAHDKWLADKLKVSRQQVTKLTADIATERANRKTEHEDRQRADQSATELQARLDAIAATPIQPVSVWCRPATVPGAAPQSGAATGPDGSAFGPGAEGPVLDIGSALSDVWREHQANAARQRALIEWERNRTH